MKSQLDMLCIPKPKGNYIIFVSRQTLDTVEGLPIEERVPLLVTLRSVSLKLYSKIYRVLDKNLSTALLFNITTVSAAVSFCISCHGALVKNSKLKKKKRIHQCKLRQASIEISFRQELVLPQSLNLVEREIFGKFASSVENKLDTMVEVLNKTNEGEKNESQGASNNKKRKKTPIFEQGYLRNQ